MVNRPVLVLDFGAQYAQLIARRVREAGYYSELVPGTSTAAQLAEHDPVALVLSGGPASVYADNAPALDPKIFELGLPIFGICYGFQAMAAALGGQDGAASLSHAARPSSALVAAASRAARGLEHANSGDARRAGVRTGGDSFRCYAPQRGHRQRAR